MADTSGDHASLDAEALDQLNGVEARALLDAVDSMRELQLNQMVDLPQIIVVGDQSSGKSSVLEAISRVSFPVKSNVCTRFATELVMRRAAKSTIDFSIKFTGKQNERQTWRRSGFTNDTLPDVIQEAEEKMGLRGENIKGFSNDILRVEVSGPDVYPLTLVDLPGFYHNATEHQSKEGIQIVEKLAESYMRQRNSIIMVVISANSQLASHKVLEEAKKHDPAHERTLGIITKPDLAEAGDERQCLRLVRGEEKLHHLSLGWHVLRNRSRVEQETTAAERDATEDKFFESSTWSCIPKAHRGVQELRKRLSNVLLNHIQRSLPRLMSEMESKLETKQLRLAALGKPRSTTADLKSYLIDIADNVRRLAQDAVSGRYHDSFFGSLEDDHLKLRAQLRSLNSAFIMTMQAKGASQVICADDDDHLDNDSGQSGKANSPPPIVVPEYLQPYVELYHFPEPKPILESELQSWLERLASVNRGKEFPDIPNADLVVQVFKSQAEPWRGIAEFHVKLITSFAKAFIDRLIGHVVGSSDKRTSTAILRGVVDPFFDERRVILAAKLEELLLPYTAGFAMPLDSEFRTRLSSRTLKRLTDKFTDIVANELDAAAASTPQRQTSDSASSTAKSRNRVKQLILEAEDRSCGGGSEFGTEKIIDMVSTAYEMSLRSFTDNVINLAVESCLARAIPDLLTPKMVNAMSEERLRELAQESLEVQTERDLLALDVERLEQGLRKCRVHRPRELTVLPSNFARRSSAKSANPSEATSSSPAAKAPSSTAQAPLSAAPSASPTNKTEVSAAAKLAKSINAPVSAPSGSTQSTPKPAGDNPFAFTSTTSSLPSHFAALASKPAGVNPFAPPSQAAASHSASVPAPATPSKGTSLFGFSNTPSQVTKNQPSLFGSAAQNGSGLFSNSSQSQQTLSGSQGSPWGPASTVANGAKSDKGKMDYKWADTTGNSLKLTYSMSWYPLVNELVDGVEVRNVYHNICALADLQGFSADEIRLHDYILTDRI